jgi:Na+-driven multidrug efflux pump
MSLLALHVVLMCFAVIIIFLADKEAVSWFSGKKETLAPVRLSLYHYLMWASLLGLMGTGVLMTLPMYTYLLRQPLLLSRYYLLPCCL